MYFCENRVLVFINICKNDISGNNGHGQLKIHIHESVLLCQLTQTQGYTAIQFYLRKNPTSTPRGCHAKKNHANVRTRQLHSCRRVPAGGQPYEGAGQPFLASGASLGLHAAHLPDEARVFIDRLRKFNVGRNMAL